jgi:hypothetical protein
MTQASRVANSAAIGIRAHSGWAVVLVVSGDLTSAEIIVRERVAVVDPAARGAQQPYHFARSLSLDKARAHLQNCAAAAHVLARQGLETAIERVRASGYKVIGCGILTATGRQIPNLAETLASHAMVHTAEGEFFRNAFADASSDVGLCVTKFRERDLLGLAATELRLPSAKIKAQLTDIGRGLGPPWTQDQKRAALGGFLLLHRAAKRTS